MRIDESGLMGVMSMLGQQRQPGAPELVGLLFMFVVIIGVIALVVTIWGTIFRKAGYSFWMALLMLVPIANLIWLLVFAFSTWPIHRELEALRAGRTGGFPVGRPYPPQPPAQMQ